MWQLSITQKRKSEFSEAMITQSVEFISPSIGKLTRLVENISSYGTAVETSFKIEKMKKE